MGLIINVYKTEGLYGMDCTNGGISSKAEGLCIVNVEGPFKPSDKHPPAILDKHVGHAIIKPVGMDRQWLMFGGNYGSTSDSRFSTAIEQLTGHRFYGAVPIHDRTETAEQQRLYSVD